MRPTPESASGALPTPVLHNMSCRPDATAQYSGRDACQRLRFWVDAMPPNVMTWREVCQAFGIACAPDDDGYTRLAAAAARPCPALVRLPPIAGVLRNAAGDSLAGLTDDPDVVLAVLARASSHVFLRDGAPTVTTDRFRLPVTLVIPTSWSLTP
ncbi:MAG: hypothetical protein RJA05_545 [Planctomycetota bacterium]